MCTVLRCAEEEMRILAAIKGTYLNQVSRSETIGIVW